MRAIPVLAAALLAAAPVAAQPADPLEPVNRRIHAFNQAVQQRVLNPLARTYEAQVPATVREGVANAIGNLGEPVTAASGLAAWELDVAANAVARFAINTTLGLGGVKDAAAERGYPRQAFTPADAACRWGVPAGPYLVLPVLGPTTLRDATARLAASAALAQAVGADALLAFQTGDALVEYAGVHRQLAQLEAMSLDGYAALRSVHLQRRTRACPGDRADEPEAE